MWSGLIALADQGRALAGEGTLDGYTQTLPKLYSLPATDFHDVTTGNNGHAAGVGYDLVTGRGTPIANLVANGLIDAVSPPVTSPPPPASPPPVTSPPPPASPPPASPPPASPPPASPPPASPPPATTSYPAAGLPAPILDFYTTISRVAVPTDVDISKLTVTLNLTHTYDSDLVIELVSPSGRAVMLSDRHGGSGDNYTNTVFDSTATRSIASAAAPFTGTFKPDGSLAIFNGLDAKGTWALEVADVARFDQGTLKGWTLTLQGSSGVSNPAAMVANSVTSTSTPAPGHPTAAPAANATMPPVASHPAIPAAAIVGLPPTTNAPAHASPPQTTVLSEPQQHSIPVYIAAAPPTAAPGSPSAAFGVSAPAAPTDPFGLHDGIFVG
jgi:subtilisin-like proprotein convertase family protein